MAAIATTTPGASRAWAAAAGGGDTVKAGDNNLLLVYNSDSSTHTFTLVTPKTVSGLAVGDYGPQTVGIGEVWPVLLTKDLFGDANGDVALSYSAATGMKVAVLAV